MQTQRIQIKDLQPGMKIKSFDPDTKKIKFLEVTDKWDTIVPCQDQRHLKFSNGTEIHCSKNHPIMVLDNELNVVQVYPDDLTFDSTIISDDGSIVSIESVNHDKQDENYIDITVANTHVFFASRTSDGPMVLTHNSQGGVRGGAATLYYPLWHLEIEDMLVLKNNKGTEENRVRHLDYGVQFNKVMYERLLNDDYITLFSPHDVPDLYEAFFIDVDKFRTLYEKYENSRSIRKKKVKALDLFSSYVQERKDTGRIYLMNVDHANDHGSFVKELAPIRMSNLCAEVTLHTKPLKNVDDPFGEIALCTLAAINWGKIKKPEDFEKPCMIAVRALDALLDYQDYPVKAAKISTMGRRPLGIGIINFAYWLAKIDLTYQHITVIGLTQIHEYAEAWSYYLIKASVDLAKEFGPCEWSNETKYHQGIMPIDTYKKDVDELARPNYVMDWDSLREDAKQYGIRNSTLMALMPSETSSQVSNSTNGIEPPRSLVSVKKSKDGVLKQVVPNIQRLKNKYDLLWDQKSPEGYLKICAVLQKFIDQAISVNTSYNPLNYKDEKIPLTEMLQHIIMHYKYGGKTLYYNNTFDGAGEVVMKETEEIQLLESIDDEASCDSCKI
jgi:ribonucleoside-diphosphate reductase alpha chain